MISESKDLDRLSQKIKTTQGQVSIWDTKPNSKSSDPTVIFIHGHCTNKTFFSSQISSPLLTNYRMISLDLLGYGKSDVPMNPEKVYCFPGFAKIVSEVVRSLDLKNIVIVGWSMGGHVALELTSQLNQLKGILITGTPPIEISAEGLSKGFRVADPKILECFGKGNLSYQEAELLATISGYDYTEAKKFLVDAILETDEGAKTIYPRSIINGVGQDGLEIVQKWPNPIAVIAGENDSGINNDYIIHEVKFRNLWRNKVHVIPNAGHAVHMERPTEFNLILSDFLKDIF